MMHNARRRAIRQGPSRPKRKAHEEELWQALCCCAVQGHAHGATDVSHGFRAARHEHPAWLHAPDASAGSAVHGAPQWSSAKPHAWKTAR